LNKKHVTNDIPLNAYTRHDSAQKRLKTQHQIIAVIINKVRLL